MKEPITARDLFVISTICTGFGVLLAWGLFYRWGSAPPVKPVDLPAWVQAIGSVIAIAVAVAVPLAQRRQLLEEQQKSKAALCRIMAIALRQPIGAFRNRCKRVREYNESGVLAKNKTPLEVFARPPEFDQFRSQLHLLGELGEMINEIVNDQTEAWIKIRNLHERKSPMSAEQSDEFSAAFEKFADRATNCYNNLQKFISDH